MWNAWYRAKGSIGSPLNKSFSLSESKNPTRLQTGYDDPAFGRFFFVVRSAILFKRSGIA